MVVRSVLFVLFSIALLFGLHFLGPDGMYSFGGHGSTLSWVSKSVIIGLAITHLFLASVMFFKRRHWMPSEASMFRFVAFKGVFWAYLAYVRPIRDAGISVPEFVLIVLMAATTFDLDVKLFGRYVLGWEDRRYTKRDTIIDNNIEYQEPEYEF